MRRAGGGGLVLAGIFLVLFGWFIGSNLVEVLLDVLKWIFVILGMVVGVVGLFLMVTKGRRRSSDF